MAEYVPVIVIGAGQSGLAMAWHLKQRGIEFIVLEAHQRIGDNWRSRWKGLRLFSPARYDNLPGKPFPTSPWYLPNKDETGNYLESYAHEFELPVHLGVEVEGVEVGQNAPSADEAEASQNAGSTDGAEFGEEPRPTRFLLKTSKWDYSCDHLIVASGSFRTPFVPTVNGIPKDLPQWHSSNYQEPAQIPAGKVLVVGAGASGQQIAVLLAREPGRKVILSGPNVPNLPRRLLGIDVYWWMYKTGVITTRLDSRRGKKMYAQSLKQGDISVGESKKLQKRLGIKRLGRLLEWRDGKAILDTCQKTSPASKEPAHHTEEIEGIGSIIWATGYRNDYSWIGADVIRKDGEPDHRRGVSKKVSGLYFIGLKFQYRINSATLGGVGKDAEYLAGVIAGEA